MPTGSMGCRRIKSFDRGCKTLLDWAIECEEVNEMFNDGLISTEERATRMIPPWAIW